jgi:hypothetical protein
MIGTMEASGNMPKGIGDFVGCWRIDRRIEDALGANGHFTGMATISPGTKTACNYRETGTLRLGETSFEAERRYRWTETSPGLLSIFFDDGRFFHSFSLSPNVDATHDCPPDWYEVQYDFASWPSWTARWRVTGPRKDYVMESRYVPE